MFFGGGMLVFWLLIAAGIVLATGNAERVMEWFGHTRTSGNESPSDLESPEEILRRRYAQGEIDREEYLERKETLEKDRKQWQRNS